MKPVTKTSRSAVLSHGAYRMQRHRPEAWPPMLRNAYSRRVNEIMELPHIQEKHRGAVIALVRAELVAAAMFEWGAEKSLLNADSGELVPSLRTLPGWLNTISRLSQVLMLTPAVDRRIVEKGDGLLSQLAGLEDVTDAVTDCEGEHEKGNGHDVVE
jgi:hypothetical protein